MKDSVGFQVDLSDIDKFELKAKLKVHKIDSFLNKLKPNTNNQTKIVKPIKTKSYEFNNSDNISKEMIDVIKRNKGKIDKLKYDKVDFWNNSLFKKNKTTSTNHDKYISQENNDYYYSPVINETIKKINNSNILKPILLNKSPSNSSVIDTHYFSDFIVNKKNDNFKEETTLKGKVIRPNFHRIRENSPIKKIIKSKIQLKPIKSNRKYSNKVNPSSNIVILNKVNDISLEENMNKISYEPKKNFNVLKLKSPPNKLNKLLIKIEQGFRRKHYVFEV